MSTTRDFDRLMEAFFEEGPSVASDRVLEAIRDDVDRIDVRAGGGSWRNSHMLRSMIAAAAVITVLLGGLAIYAAIGQPPDVGPPTDSVAPAPSDDGGLSALPAELQYSWVGPPKDIPGLAGPASDRGDISHEPPLWRFEAARGADFSFTPGVTGDGELRLTTSEGDVCAADDAGTYPWSLSRGGTILTIGAGTDACAARAAAMPGDYQRVACRDADGYCPGELDSGLYASHVFEPRPVEGDVRFRHGAMTFSVPSGWAVYEEATDVYGLTPQSDYATYEDSACYGCVPRHDLVTILSNPGAATEDCAEEENVAGIGFGAQDLVDWMAQHPGLVSSEPEATSVGGFPAISVTIQAAESWTGTCDAADPFLAVPVFYRVDSYHWALEVGERYHITLIDLGDGNTVAIVVDSADDEDLEALVEAAQPIIGSLEFPPR